MRFKCDSCGAFTRAYRRRLVDAEEMIMVGWSSNGSSIYCPKCVQDWNQENLAPLDDSDETIKLILTMMIEDAEQEMRDIISNKIKTSELRSRITKEQGLDKIGRAYRKEHGLKPGQKKSEVMKIENECDK